MTSIQRLNITTAVPSTSQDASCSTTDEEGDEDSEGEEGEDTEDGGQVQSSQVQIPKPEPWV